MIPGKPQGPFPLWQYRPMHRLGIRQEIIDRVMARRGRLHWFERLEPGKTALVIVDMQSAFCAPGGPAEVERSRHRAGHQSPDLGPAPDQVSGDLGAACQ